MMKNFVCLLFVLCFTSTLSKQLFVVPFATLFSQHSDGSLLHPYSSIQQALDSIQHEHSTVYLYPTYYFSNPIQLNSKHSHTRLTTMSIENATFCERLTADRTIHHLQRLHTAVISDGLSISYLLIINEFLVHVFQQISPTISIMLHH